MERIEGVEITDCKKIINEKGFLQEVIRDDDPSFKKFGQVYFTFTKNGISKAWYKHQIQTDFIFIVNGEMTIGLFDDRNDSKTYKKSMLFSMNSETPQLVKIPPGVWHGFKSYSEGLLLLHVNSESIKFDNIDEERLDVNLNQIPLEL